MEFTRNQKKAHDLNRHISVTAGAGSGKTAVLVHRYLKILLETDLPPNQVVAITFTEKAAAELKQRIVNEVNARLAEKPNNAKLGKIKAGMLSAQISTIHAFCSRILREFPVEAGVDPGFSMLQGIQQQLALRNTIESALREIADRPDENEIRVKLIDLLRIFGKSRLEAHVSELVNQRDVVEQLKRIVYCHTDSVVLEHWYNHVQSQLSQSLENQFPIEDWRRCLNKVLAIARGKKNSQIVRGLAASIQPNMQPQEAIAPLTEIAPLIVTQKGTISKRDFLGSRVDTGAIEEEIDFLVRAANYFRSFPVFTDDDELLICVTRLLIDVYDEVQHAYEQHKRQAGQLDFDDLQIKVRNLLQQEHSIREELAKRYPYIMVDEYQDTDQLQYEILKPLVSDFRSGNLFIVGDQNQSIYRFRGADVEVFDQTRKEITEYQSELTEDFTWEGPILESSDLERLGELRLPENFRLLRNLVGFINLIFTEIMGGWNEFEVKYEPLIQGRITDQSGDVELLIDTKERAEDDSQSVTKENKLIVGRIQHLIETGKTVCKDEGDGEKPQPIRYSDIAILIRSRTRLPEIESALLEAGIPYKITGGIGFYQQQEIYDIANYLQFLIDCKNDVALAGVLRAPFFGISDVELHEIAQYSSSVSFWQKVQDYVPQTGQSSISPIGYAVQILRNHLEICHRIPPSELIRKIVNDTGMVGVLPVGRSGKQRWANYEKLLGIAREFERLEIIDLHDFVERLDLLIKEEEREGQATTQLTENAVQIMTIHAAKGLEFPIVILPHLDRRATRYDQEPFIDDLLGIGFRPANPDKNYEQSDPGATQLMRERVNKKRVAEEKRLFYVATTRARDRLILSGTLNEKGEARGWFEWLLNALDIPGMPSGGELRYPTTIQTLTEEEDRSLAFDLPIRIIKSPDEFDLSEEEIPTPSPLADFPTFHIEPLRAATVSHTFSLLDLTAYAQCPTRFYLQRQIQVPLSEFQSEESLETTREGVNSFLNSRVREMALNADEVYRERHIHAEIGSHIVDGIANRLFKDSEGIWQVISCEIDGINWEEIGDIADYYRPQIELYALLIHRLYPEQRVIPVTIYSTDLTLSHSVEVTKEELIDIESAWIERIEAIQDTLSSDAIGMGRFEKNREHCRLCPYFVDEECTVTDQ